MVAIAVSVFFSLAFANFAFQWFDKKDYSKAFERSFFQAVALAAFVITYKVAE